MVHFRGKSIMPKFLVEVSYTAEGLKGLQRDKAAKRVAAVESAVKGVGGTVESIYWSLGERDGLAIVDVPDTAAAVALSDAFSASGMVRTKLSQLLTAAEIDAALQKQVSYRAPGG